MIIPIENCCCAVSPAKVVSYSFFPLLMYLYHEGDSEQEEYNESDGDGDVDNETIS